jgi:hypothetical protein
MKGKAQFDRIHALACLSMAILASVLALAVMSSAADRLHLHARLMPAQSLYYQVESHTLLTGKTITPIINPEGGTKLSQNVDLLVRLDVLPSSASAANAPDAVRLRATFERAHADSQSDSPRVDAPSAAAGYARLEGHSFQLTLGPGGAVSNFEDPDKILPSASEALTAFSWIKELVASNGFPRRGIAIGDKWSSEPPVDGAPLTGLFWRAESNYVRDQPCQSPVAQKEPRHPDDAPPEQCAVILTRFQIVRRGSSHADQTPPDYIRHGLRTAGTLTGSGESLDSISLESGLLVSATQTSTQRSDFDIINAANGEKIHRAGQLQMQAVITQVSAPPSPAAPRP